MSSTDDERTPVLAAHGLGLHLRSGWVFRHVTLDVAAGESVEIVGSGGTGRSMLLLALVGRARHSVGDLEVLGSRIATGRAGAGIARDVRRRTAVAQVGPLIELEGQHSVRQAASERSRWDRLRRREQDVVLPFDAAAELVGLDIRPDARVEELAAVDRTLLSVALALTAPHEVLVVDDPELGLSESEHLRVGEALVAVATGGVAVVAAGARPSGADGVRVVAMPQHDAAHAQEVR